MTQMKIVEVIAWIPVVIAFIVWSTVGLYCLITATIDLFNKTKGDSDE